MLKGYQSSAYSWDEPTKPHKLSIQINNSDFSYDYKLDILKIFEPITIIQVLSTSLKLIEAANS